MTPAEALETLQGHAEWFKAMQPIVHPYSPNGAKSVLEAIECLRRALVDAGVATEE